MPTPQALRPLLFVASLGNPTKTYAHTLHSAGHTVLRSLALHLHYPPLPSARSSSQPHGSVYHHSFPGDSEPPAIPSEDVAARATLWMSPVLMNVSGPAVTRAWKAWLSATEDIAGRSGQGRKLVVVHDELESALGAVKVRRGSLSARGHNGIKSIQASLRGGHETDFVKVGIGIGRPAGRETGEVSDWVLRKMNASEREVLEGEEVVGRVVDALTRIGS